jgi:predicted deacylase
VKPLRLLLVLAGLATEVQAQTRFTVGTAAAAPGDRARGTIQVAEAADGTPVGIPVEVVAARLPGPVVWVQALSHGDEFGGARALQRLLGWLEPEAMSGTVVAVLAANPLAFRALNRVNPNLDDLDDMGTVYPGRDRFATERAAAAINREVHGRVDYFIDLHTGGDRFRQLPFVFYTLIGSVPAPRYDSLAKAFGIPLIWRDTSRVFPRGPTTAFADQGIASFLLEVGGGQPLDPADLELQAGGVRSFLRAVGVLTGTPSRLPRYTIVRGYRIVTNGRGGFFDPMVKPGDRVQEGTPIGTITGLSGEVLETLRAPAGAMIVLGVGTYPAWPTGGWLFELGTDLAEEAR